MRVGVSYEYRVQTEQMRALHCYCNCYLLSAVICEAEKLQLLLLCPKRWSITCGRSDLENPMYCILVQACTMRPEGNGPGIMPVIATVVVATWKPEIHGTDLSQQASGLGWKMLKLLGWRWLLQPCTTFELQQASLNDVASCTLLHWAQGPWLLLALLGGWTLPSFWTLRAGRGHQELKTKIPLLW